jgi:hypothetical protein
MTILEQPDRVLLPRAYSRRNSHIGISLFLLLPALTCAVPLTASAQESITPPACSGRRQHADGSFTRTHFRFQSVFWLNLHQFLYAQAQAREGFSHRITITSSLEDTIGYGVLAPAAREGWEQALAYYQRAVAPRDFVFDSASIMANNYLATVPDSAVPGDPLEPAMVVALRAAATAYRAHWWHVHDAENREWIAATKALLTCHGFDEARRITRAFRVEWPAARLLVDVSAYAGWAGAYTTEDPGHIVISSRASGNRGVNAVASLFHESLHTMDHHVVEALRLAGVREGVSVPYDVTHALIFYTASDVTQHEIAAYSGFDDGNGAVWTRPPLMAYLPAIRRWWQPYLDNRRDFADAVAGLVKALRPILQNSR